MRRVIGRDRHPVNNHHHGVDVHTRRQRAHRIARTPRPYTYKPGNRSSHMLVYRDESAELFQEIFSYSSFFFFSTLLYTLAILFLSLISSFEFKVSLHYLIRGYKNTCSFSSKLQTPFVDIYFRKIFVVLLQMR